MKWFLFFTKEKYNPNMFLVDVLGDFRDKNYIPHWSSDHFEERALG